MWGTIAVAVAAFLGGICVTLLAHRLRVGSEIRGPARVVYRELFENLRAAAIHREAPPEWDEDEEDMEGSQIDVEWRAHRAVLGRAGGGLYSRLESAYQALELAPGPSTPEEDEEYRRWQGDLQLEVLGPDGPPLDYAAMRAGDEAWTAIERDGPAALEAVGRAGGVRPSTIRRDLTQLHELGLAELQYDDSELKWWLMEKGADAKERLGRIRRFLWRNG